MAAVSPVQQWNCRVLVFDLDDTLYPECDYVRSGFEAVDRWLRDQHGVTGFNEVAVAHFQAGRRGNIFDLSLEQLGMAREPALISRLVTVYREHKPAIRLHEDAAWALDHFRPRMKLGVITDGQLVTQQRKVAALGIEPKVDRIIYSDAFGRENWKPSTVPYCKLIEAMGCNHAECVYVADNVEKDFLAARRLGWRTIQIRRPNGEYCSRQASSDYQAEEQIASLRELMDLLP